MTQPVRLAALFGVRVSVDGGHVGYVGAVVVDASFARVIGLEVAGAESRRWFLPWIAVEVLDGAVTTESALGLIEVGELNGYTRLGARIISDRRDVGSLWVWSDGCIGGGEHDGRVLLDVAQGRSVE